MSELFYRGGNDIGIGRLGWPALSVNGIAGREDKRVGDDRRRGRRINRL